MGIGNWEGDTDGEAFVPFEPSEPIVAARDSDPDAIELLPILDDTPSQTPRYERDSGGLPRLEGDPGWSPPTFPATSPSLDEARPRWFDRFRR